MEVDSGIFDLHSIQHCPKTATPPPPCRAPHFCIKAGTQQGKLEKSCIIRLVSVIQLAERCPTTKRGGTPTKMSKQKNPTGKACCMLGTCCSYRASDCRTVDKTEDRAGEEKKIATLASSSKTEKREEEQSKGNWGPGGRVPDLSNPCMKGPRLKLSQTPLLTATLGSFLGKGKLQKRNGVSRHSATE